MCRAKPFIVCFWPFPKLNLSQYLHVSINVSRDLIGLERENQSGFINYLFNRARFTDLQESPTVTSSFEVELEIEVIIDRVGKRY
jgi:hypothetical protein